MVDNWDIEKVCKYEKKTKFNSIFEYKPYTKDNDQIILKIQENKKDIVILLRNGIVVILPFTEVNKKKSSKEFRQGIPRELIIPTRIINISCGREHTLAKGRNFNVYSWGINTYGQLGLEKPASSETEVFEPTPINFSSGKSKKIKIDQIYAQEYCSFFIGDKNEVFACGKNDRNQLCLGKNGLSKVNKPEKTAIRLESEKTFAFFPNNNCQSLFFCNIDLPDKSNINIEEGKNMEKDEFQKNKEEILSVQKQIKDMKKVCINAEEYNELLQKVESLRAKYVDKIIHDNYNTQDKNKMEEINTQKFDNQTEYFFNKKNDMEKDTNYLDKYYSCLDGRIINKMIKEQKKKKLINAKEESSKGENDNLIKKKGNGGENNQTGEVYLFSDNIPKLKTLFERVSNEVQMEKFKYLEESHKEVDKSKFNDSHNKKMNDYISIFDSIIDEIKEKIDEINDKSTNSESENIKEKCLNEYQNFIQNTLKTITTSNLDIQRDNYSSLTDMIQTSMDNYVKLNQKIDNIKFNDKTKYPTGKNILELFHQDIVIAQQNNALVEFMLNKLVNNAYGKTLEKGGISCNISKSDYNNIKRKVDEHKKKQDESHQKIKEETESDISYRSNYSNGSKMSMKSQKNNYKGDNMSINKRRKDEDKRSINQKSQLSESSNEINNNLRFVKPQEDNISKKDGMSGNVQGNYRKKNEKENHSFRFNKSKRKDSDDEELDEDDNNNF